MERGQERAGGIPHGMVFSSSMSYRMRKVWPIPFLGLIIYLMMFPFYILFFTLAESYIYLLCMSPLLAGFGIVYVFRNQFYFTIRPPEILFEKDHLKIPTSEGLERPYVKIGYSRLIRLELVPRDHHTGGLQIFRYGKKILGLGPEISSVDEIDIERVERVVVHFRSRNVSGSSQVEIRKEFFRSDQEFLEFVNMMMHIGRRGRRRPK
jgi:hypothetical protein